jgi:hypothetical protein
MHQIPPSSLNPPLCGLNLTSIQFIPLLKSSIQCQMTCLKHFPLSSKQSSDTVIKCNRVANASTSQSNAFSIATGSKITCMRSVGFLLSNGKSSLGEKQEEDSIVTISKPSHVWCANHTMMPTSTGDHQTTVNLVAMERVFPQVKFIDRATDLIFSNDKQ